MQLKSELPEGWINTILSNVGKITTGNTPPKKDPNNFGDKYPWAKPSDLNQDIPITKTEEYLSEKGALLARLLPVDAVLVSCIGNLGKVGIAGTQLATNQQINTISFHNQIVYPKYGYYYCKSEILKNWLEDNSSATTIQIINKTRFSEAPILIPPLAEQHRIVAAIDALFARLDAANERLDRVPEILKTFRQSVLAAACDGRLTEGWREENPDVEDSSEYLEKIKAEKSTKITKHEKCDDVDTHDSFLIPDKWNGVKIGIIETFIGSGITPKGGRSVYVNEGIPFIRSQNVYPKGLILDDIAYVTPEMHQKMKRTHVFSGDVLLNITGASIGRSTYVPENFGEANVNQHVCIIRCGWWILPRYFSMFLNSDSGQSQIFKMQTGQTREGLNYTQIRNMFVALPPLPEQHEIVRRVVALFALADSIEAKVATARERTEKLRQSILAKAFSGELVPTEAELARREGRDYEPADVLLERLKAGSGG